jgi:hypothetical protein
MYLEVHTVAKVQYLHIHCMALILKLNLRGKSRKRLFWANGLPLLMQMIL